MTPAAIDHARSLLVTRRQDELPPEAVRFLLHECTRLTDASLRAAVELGLTRALAAAHTDPDPWQRIGWVALLADAVRFSDDDRLGEEARRALPAAVDRLEHDVRRRYEPGDGLTGATCLDEVRAACALLEALALTGRVPYGMLAEELWRHVRRCWWDETTGALADDLRTTCAGLRVAVRLSAWHADPDYVAAAVVGTGPDLQVDARRMVEAILGRLALSPDEAVDAGPALSEWFALQSDLQ